jgi:hypothetical protein
MNRSRGEVVQSSGELPPTDSPCHTGEPFSLVPAALPTRVGGVNGAHYSPKVALDGLLCSLSP